MQRNDVIELYKPGRKPKYAPDSDEEDEEEFEDDSGEDKDDDGELEPIVSKAPLPAPVVIPNEEEDPRLAKLKKFGQTVPVPRSEIRYNDLSQEESEASEDNNKQDDSGEDYDDVRKRHQMARQMLQTDCRPFMPSREETFKLDSESEEEDESSDDSNQPGPMLKPVFLRKEERMDREKEYEEGEIKRQEKEEKMYEERRQQALALIQREKDQELAHDGDEIPQSAIESINTDDEDEEIAYEKWRLRELARIKRDKQSRSYE